MKITREELRTKTSCQLCGLFKQIAAVLATYPQHSAEHSDAETAAAMIREEQACRGPAP